VNIYAIEEYNFYEMVKTRSKIATAVEKEEEPKAADCPEQRGSIAVHLSGGPNDRRQEGYEFYDSYCPPILS